VIYKLNRSSIIRWPCISYNSC